MEPSIRTDSPGKDIGLTLWSESDEAESLQSPSSEAGEAKLVRKEVNPTKLKNEVENIPDASEPQEDRGGDGNESLGNDQTTDKNLTSGWDSSTTLWCSKNGRSHATLVDFEISICPSCRQDLTSKPKPSAEPKSTAKSDSQDTEHASPVTYAVQYMDIANDFIGRTPLSGPFDLKTVRKGVVPQKEPAFEVLMIAGTSIAHDDMRLRFERQQCMEEVSSPKTQVYVRSSTITIHSQALVKALTSVISYYPSIDVDSEALTLNEPFPVIAHYLEELEKYRSSYVEDETAHSSQSEFPTSAVLGTKRTYDKLAIEQLGLLLDHIKHSVYQNKIEEEMTRHRRNTCTYRMLWLLFKPGQTVYMESEGRLLAYVVERVQVDPAVLSHSVKQLEPYKVWLWNLDFDGRFIGRRSFQTDIAYFDGERPIDLLSVVPCDFADKKDSGRTRNRMEEEGKKWFELLRGKQMHYAGDLITTLGKQFRGRVYVDSRSYYSEAPAAAPDVHAVKDFGKGLTRCLCPECRGFRPHPLLNFPWARYDVIDPQVEQGLELSEEVSDNPNHRYLLCNRTVWGFVLKSRKWELLDVAFCYPAEPNTAAIDTLVMPSERKSMIKALVQKFTDQDPSKTPSAPWGADFIENKGEGQIFLLHGSPGVGKTYTAECIAEYTSRALLSLNCGDIGTDEVIMERQLSKWFNLAERWGAVVLIDEADVYLEKRQVTDLKRNSLVSVFLRSIEYYRGILFLTTNRVGHFDDAFVSRIHVIIRYENLGPEDRKKIWSQFFEKLSNDRLDFMITPRAREYVLSDDAIASMEWNGREIRNVFQTAVALAEYRYTHRPSDSKQNCPTLDQKDFEQVCDMTRQFKQYLIDVHGADEEDRAWLMKARASHKHNNQLKVKSNERAGLKP